jgi:hypothetical protein
MKDDKDIFKKIRELPPEMNVEEVKGLIAGFPATPLPQNHWFSKITFKNILMITLPTTVVLSTLLLFFPVKEQEKIAVVENPTPIIKELVVDTSPQNQSIQSVARPIKKLENPKRSRITGKFKIDTLRDIKRIHPILKMPIRFLELDIEPILSDSYPKLDSIKILKTQEEMDCQLLEGSIREFKMRLERALEEDKLFYFTGRKAQLFYSNDKIVLNGRFIPEEFQEKYAGIFAEYNIVPCPTFIIQIAEKYMAVGKITAQGFNGRVDGNIEIDHLDKIRMENLSYRKIWQEERQVEDFHSLIIKGRANVHIVDGEQPKVRVEANNIKVEDILTTVQESILTIDVKGISNHGYSHDEVQIFIEAPLYRSIVVEDVAKIETHCAIMAEDLSIIVRHQAEAKLEIDAEEVTIDVVSGDLVVFGRAGKQIITGRPPLHQGSFDNSHLKIRDH